MSNVIAFSCQNCGEQLQVKESLAGTIGTCPKCSHSIQAPMTSTASSSDATKVVKIKNISAQPTSGQPTLRPASPEEETAPPPSSQRSHPRPYSFLAPPQGPGELGRLGPYRIQKLLGTGSMGVVFLAEDSVLKRPVALKVMKPSLAAFSEFHRRFLREAQLAASIDHEHIVTIYQVGEDRGVPYLAMKLLHGETLENRLNETVGGMALPEVLRIGREIAEGLAAAHARGLVHRDIKPANVWLESGRDKVMIVDFGLARGTAEDGHCTRAGSVIGTPAYMAPEQANAEPVDARCDLFSLGAVLYRASTGEMPFPGKDTLSVLAALATKTPPAPSVIVPALPRVFSDLVMRLLAKDRTKRLQSARELIETIEKIEKMGAEPASAPLIPAEAEPETPLEEVPLEEVDQEPPLQETQSARIRYRVKTQSLQAEDETAVVTKKKSPAKTLPHPHHRRKKRRKENDWGGWVLLVSVILLTLAFIVLALGIVRYYNQSRESAPKEASSISVPHNEELACHQHRGPSYRSENADISLAMYRE